MNGVGGDGEKKWPGWPGENVFRMLVPALKVGSIIGRKGEFIRKVSDESRARIKILHGPPASSERAVMVSAKEEPDAPIPPSMDGLLRIHRRILGLDNDYDHTIAGAGAGGRVITRLLVADPQAGSLIGRQGATIKSIQDAFNCIIQVLGGEHLPVFSLKDDSVVEIEGEPTCVHTVVELIASHLWKFLVLRSIIGVFEMQYTMHANSLSYANAVIGKSGANISYMCHASGAAIAVQETRDVPGDMTIEISGSASEVQAAEQLIRNFIAEAASTMQSPPGRSIIEEYSPYQVHAPVYASSDANGHVCHVPAIDYGSVYDTDYGY